MDPRWLSAALGVALIVAAEAAAQPAPQPAGSSETRSDWNVSAGYSTFAFRDIAITGIPMDGSPTSLEGGAVRPLVVVTSVRAVAAGIASM